MLRFAVNTGCREQEICQLRWEWEVQLPEIGTAVFIVPESVAKNGRERVIVLNNFARAAVERSRGKHDEFVFTHRVSVHHDPKDRRSPIVGYENKPLTKIYNSAWKRARRDAA
ncbi:MAG: tyrosine-type recombinase/integrase, partial [Gammaproteobacteria bacterium]